MILFMLTIGAIVAFLTGVLFGVAVSESALRDLENEVSDLYDELDRGGHVQIR